MIRPPEASRFGGDIAIELDSDGTIRQIRFGTGFASDVLESVGDWSGRRWVDTVSADTRGKAEKLLFEVSDSGVTGFRQIQQGLPGGASLPVEYAAVRGSGDTGTILLGRDLRPVEELQRRYVEAQQSMERDYWKLRQVETRYRMIFRDAPEPGVVVAPDSLRVLDANPAAMRLLGFAAEDRIPSLLGRSLLADILPDDRTELERYVRIVAGGGGAAPVRVSVGPAPVPVLIRATAARQDGETSVFLRMAQLDERGMELPSAPVSELMSMMERIPDGFALVDPVGDVLWANRAFAELVQVPRAGIHGRNLREWLDQPGGDWDALHHALDAHGTVRAFPGGLSGDLGAETLVEVSAAAAVPGEPSVAGIVIRDVGRR